MSSGVPGSNPNPDATPVIKPSPGIPGTRPGTRGPKSPKAAPKPGKK